MKRSHRRRSALTVNDLFCGAGGSSIGAVAAGAELKRAFNHWRLAIDTHASNFKDADHVCADIMSTDPRRFEATDILLASPECTNHSLAKAKRKEMPLFDEPDEAADRSRATMWDVVRFAEHHRYQLCIVENVIDAMKWESFGAWLHAMVSLGYEYKIVSLNSFAAPPTPQSRDRMYVVFWRKGNRAPDLDIRIPSWCPKCERVVQAVQSFKNQHRPWGKYGVRAQYVYRCGACRTMAFPFVAPAATAIDWTLKGQRIGDREKPLKPATIRRIEEGLRRYARPLLAQVGGHSFARPGYVRAWPVDAPAPTQMGTPHHGLVVPAGGTWKRGASSTGEPMPTTMPRDTHGLLVPLSHVNGEKCPTTTDVPMPTQTARQDVAFVVTQRQRAAGRAHDPGDPLTTVTATNQHALITTMRGTGDGQLDGSTRPVSDPLGTVSAGGTHHALVVQLSHANAARPSTEPMPTQTTAQSVALVFGHYGGNSADGNTRPVTEPIGPVTANAHPALLVPYYGTGVAAPVEDPIGTVTTRDRHALVETSPAVEDCTFRMLEPHEIGAAMAFPSDYIVLGNKRERVRQYGNAVTPPAMTELLRRCVASLDGDRT